LSALESSPLPFGRLGRLRSVSVGLKHLLLEELYKFFLVHTGHPVAKVFFEVLDVAHIFAVLSPAILYFLGGLRWLLACGSWTDAPSEVKGLVPLTERKGGGCIIKRGEQTAGSAAGVIKQKDRIKFLPFCLQINENDPDQI